MSDNLKILLSVKSTLIKAFPLEAKGYFTNQLNILAGMISGIVGSKRCNLPQIAKKIPDETKPDSREKKISRFLKNNEIKTEIFFLPFAQKLLAALGLCTLTLIMDGSTVGRNCNSLMISVYYKGRAIPLAWIVVRGKKGHFPEEMHCELVEKAHGLIPKETKVEINFVGDGEFDGVELQKTMAKFGWKYTVRTAKNAKCFIGEEGKSASMLIGEIKEGEVVDVPGISFTDKKYGPVTIVGWWKKGNKEPMYLVTTMGSAWNACTTFNKRFSIETYFSDQKSRGFNLHKSHISDPERLSRLMIACCLAYIWIVYLGDLCMSDGFNNVIHRTHRCDLSLFQMGIRFIEYLLNEGKPVPVSFRLIY